MKNNRRYLILLEIAILIFIVLRLINIGGEPVFSSNSGSYVVPGTMTREFSFFDYISFWNLERMNTLTIMLWLFAYLL